MFIVHKKYDAACGVVGNVLTWYSFALLMPFLPILSKKFFSYGDQSTCSILSFLSVSVGLFMRPLGSMLFGPIGDKIGRRRALSTSILFMAVPTVAMGLLPDCEQWGLAASLLFVSLRVIQGISMGGEYSTAMVHFVELAENRRRGFFGSFSDAGSQAGVLLTGQALIILHIFFTEQEIYDYAWRYPFLAAALLIPFAFISSSSDAPREKTEKYSIVKSLLKHKKEVSCTVAITSFSAMGFYTLLTFVPYFFVRENILTLNEAAKCSVYANIFIVISALGCGYLSDIFGRKFFLIGGMLGVSVSVYLMFLTDMRSFDTLMLLNMLYGACLGMYFSSRAAFFSEAFPKRVRCTGVSISMSLAQAVVGGSSTLIMDYFTSISKILSIAPITLLAILGIWGVSVLKDRTGKDLLE
ncbi:MAG: MFS transporter [Holosporaceae bacterium]|jgi:MHS family proline/betaine transporter-like MFS transporter|nr:MFS transporter [Holosporaceae bacterium]